MKHAEKLWQTLAAASQDTKHPWNILSLATCDAAGSPQLRSIILRELDCKQCIVSLFTDRRSHKVKEINHSPKVALLFWNSQTREQLRLSGTARIDQDPQRLDACWQSVTEQSRINYATVSPPGAVCRPASNAEFNRELNVDPDFDLNVDLNSESNAEHYAAIDLSQARQNFAVIDVSVSKMDYLRLGRNGHVRQGFDLSPEGEWLMNHLTP